MTTNEFNIELDNILYDYFIFDSKEDIYVLSGNGVSSENRIRLLARIFFKTILYDRDIEWNAIAQNGIVYEMSIPKDINYYVDAYVR